MPVTIRPTTSAESVFLPHVERSAASAFLTTPDLAWIATDNVMAEAVHLRFTAQGTHWVAVKADNEPLGFLVAERFDNEFHIWELAVRFDCQGQGIGRALLDHACAFAASTGLAAATLTTFRDVPWNAPFYGRCGFAALEKAVIGARLEQVFAHEEKLGLPVDSRCAMRRITVPRKAP